MSGSCALAMFSAVAGVRLPAPAASLRGIAAPAAGMTVSTLLPSAVSAAEAAIEFTPRGITPEDTIVFVVGCVPFLWATVEFWRRIAVGDPFGTGQDSVIINDTSGQRKQAVRRVLGQDAIIAARILFGLAAASAVLVVIAGVDVTATR